MEKTPIRERLDAYIAFMHKDDADRTKHIHVTDLARCPVGVWLEKTDQHQGETGAAKLRRFEVGHMTEKLVEDSLRHHFLIVEEDHKRRLEWPEVGMIGTADLPIREHDQRYLIEVKSIHPNALDNMERDADGRILPHDHYVEQLNLYLAKYPDDYLGRIFYLSLDGRSLEIDVPRDSAVVARAMEKAAALHRCVLEKRKPEPLPLFIKKVNRKGETVWALNWKVKYCISDGLHRFCQPELVPDDLAAAMRVGEMSEMDFSDKWIGRLEYQAKKMTKDGVV